MVILVIGLLICFIIIVVLAETAPEYEELKDGTLRPINAKDYDVEGVEYFLNEETPSISLIPKDEAC